MGALDPVTVVELKNKSKKRPITVTVVLTVLSVSWSPEPIPDQYIVTSSTGFRAEVKACYRDTCLNGELEACACKGQKAHGSVNKWLAHSRNRCHEWHTEKIIEFAQMVLKSCTSTLRVSSTVGGNARGSYLAREYATCPSWPIERCPTEPGGVYFTDGRRRPLNYGFDINTYTIETPEDEDYIL